MFVGTILSCNVHFNSHAETCTRRHIPEDCTINVQECKPVYLTD